jgi:hypothetical protein
MHWGSWLSGYLLIAVELKVQIPSLAQGVVNHLKDRDRGMG